LLSQSQRNGGLRSRWLVTEGAVVDAVVRTGDKIIPIDSKFPLESFQRYIEASEGKKKSYLRVIYIGLRGMQFERNVRKIVEDFARLNKEFENFEEQFRKLGGHLGHAKGSFDRADRQLDIFSDRLALIGESREAKAERPTS